MKIEEFRVYQMSMEIAEDIFKLVKKWDYFSKDTIGKQLIRSVDSVAANLSEGYGRYHYKRNQTFLLLFKGFTL